MISTWPMVPLREVLAPVSRPEPVDPEKTYHILGARWYAHGLYTKDILTGGEIQAPKVYRVEEGDFVYNRLFAWKGSFAVATHENSDCYVSNEFPCFRAKDARVNLHYLWRYFSREPAWSEALGLSSGGTPTSRNRLKEEAFLQLEIPLPSLDEQCRLVGWINTLATRIDEVKRLRNELTAETSALTNSASRMVFSGLQADATRLSDVCTVIIDCLHSNPVYSEDGIPTVRSPDVGWGNLFLNTARKTGEAEYQRRTSRGEPTVGDVIVVREGGGTGKAGIVEEGQRFSLGQRVMMLRPDRDKIDPKYLLYQWLSPLVYEDQIMSRMMGSASPHLNIGAAKTFEIRLPPLGRQRLIVAFLDGLREKAEELTRTQAAAANELQAMIPAILDQAFRGEL